MTLVMEPLVNIQRTRWKNNQLQEQTSCWLEHIFVVEASQYLKHEDLLVFFNEFIF